MSNKTCMTGNRRKRALRTMGITALCVLLALTAAPYVFPLSRAEPVTDPKPFPNSESKTINGITFHYRVYPSDTDETKGKLLLVHGMGGSTFSFEAAAPLIARQGYFVVSVDLPGFGYSDRNLGYDHSQANRARDLWQLLTVIDRKMEGAMAEAPWHLAGHSMGGGTVAAMALQNESRVKSLILIDAALFESAGRSAAAAFPPFGRWLGVALEHFLLNESGVRRFLASAYGRAPTSDEIRGYLTPLTLPGTAGASANFIRTAKSEDAARLSGTSTPIIAVWGEKDTWVPPGESEKLLAIRPDAKISIITGAAHCPMETHTEEFVRIVMDWLSSVGGPVH